MKFVKSDHKYIILSLVLCVFILGFFLFHALQWAFAAGEIENIGYDAFSNSYWNSDTHSDIVIKTSSPISCLYFDSDRGILMYSKVENDYIGSYWYSGDGLTVYNQNTSGTGPFTLGQSGFYEFLVSSRQIVPTSSYPIFDDSSYALQYLNGDNSVLQYAINYGDLVQEDSLLNDAIDNYYFSDIGNNYATFILTTKNVSTEQYKIFARVTYVSCTTESNNRFNNGLRANGLNTEGWNLISNNGTKLSENSIVLGGPSLSETITTFSGWYGLVSQGVKIHDGVLFTPDSNIQNPSSTLIYPAFYYSALNNIHPLCGAVCVSHTDEWQEIGTISPGASFSNSFNMYDFLDYNVYAPSNDIVNFGGQYVVNGGMPLAYQVEFYIATADNRKSETHVLLGTIDGSLTDTKGNGTSTNQSQSIINGNGQVSGTSYVGTNGLETGQYGDVSLDNSNILEFIQNGALLGGNNGIIAIFQNTLSFLPSEIWALIFFALALSIVLMVVKILRGM